MNCKQHFIFIILIGTFFNSLPAQSVIAELQKVRNAYSSTKNLSAQVTVVAYKEDRKGALLGTGKFCKNGELYYSRFNNEEMLINQQGTLVIDHDEKYITWFEPLAKAVNKTSTFISIDSLINKGDSAIDNGIANGHHKFTIYSEGIVEKTVMLVDIKTNLVNKLITYYRQLGSRAINGEEQEQAGLYKVEVEYKNSIAPFDQQVFSESKYIIFKHKKPLLTKAFADYRITVSENEL